MKISTVCFVNSFLNALFEDMAQEDVEAVAELLNSCPRKCLCWKTPKEIFLFFVALD